MVMNEQNTLFAGAVACYSLICLWSFLNLSYIRDFDALQANFMPVMLAIISINLLMKQGFKYSLGGMTLALIMDANFAIRYEKKQDTLEYTSIELFSMQSWTQQVFDKKANITLQITAAAFIFA